MQPRSFVPGLLLLLHLATAAGAADSYNYLTAAELEARLAAGEPTHIVDIQPKKDFAKRHIKGAIPTHAYPVKSPADKARLAAILDRIAGDDTPVVIVGPRGAGGSARTYDYLLERGVAAERLLILERGQEGWTCAPFSAGK